MTGVLKGGVETGTQGEHHVATEAGVGARPLQAKEPPGLLAITGSWKRWGKDSTQSFRGKMAPLTL